MEEKASVPGSRGTGGVGTYRLQTGDWAWLGHLGTAHLEGTLMSSDWALYTCSTHAGQLGKGAACPAHTHLQSGPLTCTLMPMLRPRQGQKTRQTQAFSSVSHCLELNNTQVGIFKRRCEFHASITDTFESMHLYKPDVWRSRLSSYLRKSYN